MASRPAWRSISGQHARLQCSIPPIERKEHDHEIENRRRNAGETRILHSAGIPIGAKQPDAAKALIKFFASPAAAPVIKAKGLEPA